MSPTHHPSSTSIEFRSLSHSSQEALADLALEDIYPSKEGFEDIVLLETKKITEEQFIERAISRAKS